MADPGALVKRWLPAWAKEPARRGVRTYGKLTSSTRPLPDYLIIGTKRGGTTSLWKSLLSHPQVVPMYPAEENVKSPHYFDIHFDRGEDWYRSYFPTAEARSRRAGATSLRTVVGDASPYYMFHPLAAERVARTIPAARLIVLLRNPTDRAYSHYLERRKEGTEPLSFRQALAAEEQRLAGEETKILARTSYYSAAHDYCSYLARGRYLEQLDRWLSAFEQKQLLIVRSEDFYQDPSRIIRQVFRFLDLEIDPARVTNVHLNQLPRPHMDPDSRRYLDTYFRPHIQALEARLGRSFQWSP